MRDSHAAYDDRVFRWDDPPEGGHPGEAHKCRCYAEPIAQNVPSNVVLADFAPTADSFPSGNNTVRRLGNGLLARSPAGLAAYAALEASNRLQDFTRAANERRVRDAAEILGADLDTVEGILAAQAYAMAKELAENGFLSNAPERGNRARVIAEAIGLYEMYQPGLFTLPNENAAEAVELARQLAAQALAALEANQLAPLDGELAQGWVEVFPELTEDERRLGELQGFTPERIEQWLETYPIEELGLPNSTGSPIPGDPTDNIISTPIPEETGPSIVAREIGNLTTPDERDLPDDFDGRAIDLANENGVLRPREGRAGARYEAATGTTLARPDPADPAYDFIDTSNGERIEVKGPIPEVNGVVPEERLDGLIEATIDEANLQTGADRIVVDAEGLSATQIDRLRRELENRVSSDIPVDIMR